MGSGYQAELQGIAEQVETLLKKLSDASPSERYEALKTFRRTSNHFVECIDALNEGDSSLLGTEKSSTIAAV